MLSQCQFHSWISLTTPNFYNKAIMKQNSEMWRLTEYFSSMSSTWWVFCSCLSLQLRTSPRQLRNYKHDTMNNVQRNFFKFLFILAVWSFLLIGLIKLNNDNIDLSSVSLVTSQAYLKKIPLHRNLLQKEKWNQNFIDQTSTTAAAAERTMSFVDHEVLVDNRTGKKV